MEQGEPLGCPRVTDLRSSLAQLERAAWIQDPQFFNLPIRNFLHKEKQPALDQVDPSDPRNVHSLFRKEFLIPGKGIESAYLWISADDYYKAYLNGSFVGQGPAPAYVFEYPFNGWDVTGFIRKGETNALAVHTYYQGLVNRVWCSGDNRAGLIAALVTTYTDGTTNTILTDPTWRVFQCKAWSGEKTGYSTQFLENVDLRLWPYGWDKAGFDDRSWPYAVLMPEQTAAGYHLVPQETPPLEFRRVVPERIVQTEAGRYLIDFGRERVGHTAFRVSGPRGHTIEIRHGEELSGVNAVRYKLRASCVYQEFITLSGRTNDEFTFYDYKGFRYVEVLNWPGELSRNNIWMVERHFPFDESASSFTSSHKLLKQIWDLCENGVRGGAQEIYVDCPTREKGEYLGDAYITGISQFYTAGSLSLQKRALRQFSLSERICPGLMAVAPGYVMQEIADYSLLWPAFLWKYYMFSGDKDFLRQMIPTLDGLLAYFRRYENADGLLEKINEKWNLVDWPKNLRDDYDYDRAVNGVNTVLNAFYYGTLIHASRIYESLGSIQQAQECRSHAARLQKSFLRILFDKKNGLFVDAKGSTHHSLHANALPLTFGMVPDEQIPDIVRFLKKKRIRCGVYFASFLLRGLFAVGEKDFAFDLLTSHDKCSWYNMIASGATACMEAWGPDQKWNTSWLHPWASAPIFIIAENILGLKPGKPGWAEVDFSPQTPEGLDQAQLTITTPKGQVAVQYNKKTTGELEYRLTLPEGSRGRVRFRNPVPQVFVNGTEAEAQPQGEWSVVSRIIEPGENRIMARY